MSNTIEKLWIFRPWFYSPKEGEKSTPENIQKQYKELNPKPSYIKTTSPATSLGLGALVIGGVLCLFGASKENNGSKWGGGILAVASAVVSIIGKFSGVELNEDKPNAETPPVKPPPQLDLNNKQKKEAEALVGELVKNEWGARRAESLMKIKNNGYATYATTLLLRSLDLCPFEDNLQPIIHSLGELGDKRAVKPLIKILHEDVFKKIPTFTVTLKALGTIGDKSATSELIKYLKNVGHYHIAAVCGDAIGDLSDGSIQDELIEIAQDKPDNPAIGAITALGYIKSDRSREVLEKCLERNYISDHAVNALMRQGDRKSVLPLIKYYSRSANREGIRALQNIDPSLPIVISTLRDTLGQIECNWTKRVVESLIEELELKVKQSTENLPLPDPPEPDNSEAPPTPGGIKEIPPGTMDDTQNP